MKTMYFNTVFLFLRCKIHTDIKQNNIAYFSKRLKRKELLLSTYEKEF
jgi:hypothetical protein